ncbi:MAG: YicC family protein [Cyclobacteriaceae bacterium]
MLNSMTGFGSAEATTDQYTVKVEVKTLNSKFLDLATRFPRELSDKEAEIKNLATEHLKRGKVNLSVDIVPTTTALSGAVVNRELFKSYYSQFMELATEMGADTKDVFRLALHSPEVIAPEPMPVDLDWKLIRSVLIEALTKCNEFRIQEGKSLQEKFSSYLDAIAKGLDVVTNQDPNRIAQIKQRISSNIEEISEKTKVDQNRFEQELIYYIEKIDITEEKVRLAGHLKYFREVMESGSMQGKKLGFISQEIGREINTIGAKANDALIQREVVQMKDELEKIKEQCMNII